MDETGAGLREAYVSMTCTRGRLALPAGSRPAGAKAVTVGGYVLKNEEAAELRAAILAVAAGKDWVSPRLAYIFATDDAPDRPALSAQETRTLRLYASGMPIKSAARRLSISEETAKQYVRRVREKYAQANRAAPTKVDLYYRAVEDGHLPSPPSHGSPPRRQGHRRRPSSAHFVMPRP